MGIRSMLYRRGAQTARAVAGSRTVGRSLGASTKLPRSSRMGSAALRSSFGRPTGLAGVRGGVTARSIGSRATRSGLGARGITPGSIRSTPSGRMSFPSASSGLQMKGIRPGSGSIGRQANAMMDSLRPADVARPGRMRRMGQFAKRHPFMLGGMGVAMGYNAGRQDTGPGITTTNTTGVYQY